MDRLDLFALFDGRPTLDLREPASDVRWTELFADALEPGQAVRSLLGVRITSGGHLAGHLLVGSTQPGVYQEPDLAALVRLGAILGPKIDAYVLSSQLHTLRKQLVHWSSGSARSRVGTRQRHSMAKAMGFNMRTVNPGGSVLH